MVEFSIFGDMIKEESHPGSEILIFKLQQEFVKMQKIMVHLLCLTPVPFTLKPSQNVK